jgi:hypothetical protein
MFFYALSRARARLQKINTHTLRNPLEKYTSLVYNINEEKNGRFFEG